MAKKTREHDLEAERRAMEREVAGLADVIGRSLPPTWRFAIWLADVGDAGSTAYASNMRRDDFLALLEDLRGKLVVDKGH